VKIGPLKIAVLGQPNSWYAADLARAAQARGHSFQLLPFERLSAKIESGTERIFCGENDLHQFDALIIRTMPPGSLEQVVLRMDLLAQLQSHGIQVVNPPKAVECAVDKYLTTTRLAAAGLPVPDTWACEDEETSLAAFEALGRDVVVKPLFGAEGRGILRLSDPDLALRTFRTLSRIQSVLYIQKYVDHPGQDIRVIVLDGKVLGGMRRSNPTDFRTNISRKATAEPVELTPEQCDWALRASAAIGTRIAGIDLLYDRAGLGYVIEVNGVPGWKAFSQTTNIDVATELINSLEQYSPR